MYNMEKDLSEKPKKKIFSFFNLKHSGALGGEFSNCTIIKMDL